MLETSALVVIKGVLVLALRWLAGKSKGSLIDDEGPWKDPTILALVEAGTHSKALFMNFTVCLGLCAHFAFSPSWQPHLSMCRYCEAGAGRYERRGAGWGVAHRGLHGL
jgi:hypothetical protein